MHFITDSANVRGTFIGPEQGARHIFRAREHLAPGVFVGLHTHRGEESFEVRSGSVRFTVGSDHCRCGPVTILFVPPGIRHGFVVESATVLDVFSQQDMGVCVVVVESDGSEREEEIFMLGFPSSHAPAPGQPYTPRERIRELYATTRHLLGPEIPPLAP